MFRPIFFALALGLALPGAASAQFSDSYNFLKHVRDRDGTKATEMMSKPGSVIIDTKDGSTEETALHIVMKDQDLIWINFLLGKGADPDSRDKLGNTPLMVATEKQYIEGASALIKRRAKVDLANRSGETPLIRAVQLRSIGMVRLLLNAGANPNKADRLAGMTALDYAKRDNRGAAILKILEEPRAKPVAVSGPKL